MVRDLVEASSVLLELYLGNVIENGDRVMYRV